MFLTFALFRPEVHVSFEHEIVLHIVPLLFSWDTHRSLFSLLVYQTEEMRLEIFEDLINIFVVLHRPFQIGLAQFLPFNFRELSLFSQRTFFPLVIHFVVRYPKLLSSFECFFHLVQFFRVRLQFPIDYLLLFRGQSQFFRVCFVVAA